MSKIKVFIVDDSVFFRATINKMLTADPNYEVVGEAFGVDDALRKLSTINPDVITLDMEMPGKKGSDFLNSLKKPIPVVLVSAVNMNVFEALRLGAVDFVRKGDTTNPNATQNFFHELRSKIKIASVAKVKLPSAAKPEAPRAKIMPQLKRLRNDVIIAIGASTGGTEATLEVLKDMPANSPPILVTQHMPAGFTKMYSDRLDKICKVAVVEAENNMRIKAATAYIAPGDFQMTIKNDAKGFYISCLKGEKVSGHCPSVDVLFDSMAKVVKSKAVGVILTGMGSDGAKGLLAMKQTGAYTIGQNKDTCVVYGMPKVAFDLGAVALQQPVGEISKKLVERINMM